ncbi:LysR family transcriptional regulator [Ancylobacter sp. Lp-2]|uniref:LysR family transcriptional regulator n=1 Tax=Ancylobacter sp. Lp-2 TaxID=2881339 RepID=UPI001E52135D|nr:LysR substrate-binding domain-containing protein [Ancylobacter sp. Lp-2]MCB4771499.1 LysR family transcriptional regulator [Ancylobacter sp. Lp-2]
MDIAGPLNVNMKLLQSFLAVADQGSFRLAGEMLNRSHSAISAQIMQLEAQLDLRLFERTTRHVRLTEEGHQLYESARRALYELELGIRRIRESADFKRGQLSLAASSNLASTYLPKVLAEFVETHPQIAVTVSELTSRDLFDAVVNRKVDFAIGPEKDDATLSFETILVEPLQALIPAHYPQAQQPAVTLEELVRVPLILSSPATAIRDCIEVALRARGLSVASRFQFMKSQTIVAMAEAGLGAAILPASSLIRAQSPTARIVRIEPAIRRKMALITLPDTKLSPAAARLADKIVSDIRLATDYRPD